MTTSAAKHLQTIRDIAFRRILLDEAQYPEFRPQQYNWDMVIRAMQSLCLPDGSAAVASMAYGVKLPVGTFGTYQARARHIDIGAGVLTDRSLATCFHEMAHAIMHHDVSEKCYRENEAWLEAEADVTSDVVLMLMGLAPRRSTQWRLTNMGNIGDIAAFFHFAGASVLMAAGSIFTSWENACTPKRHLQSVA